ncbi:Metallo-dependent hydrolase [Tilletiopsis washingtonensis]|uniref:Metallo-dependent hydrolase n=1 Tax=Tilletiopsis washingtonensis TaxID=58919 RepID=A0A316ZHE8_9BASI|nr:Metallo-dependent hydrolase [Tilletiopsis washingtonensis]PWO00479.1 Metallo-dependent hydrolase [Tilletiopsis washingtonensis]
MCPGSSTHAQHADTRETDGQEAPEGTWQLLVDVHCHPTDDPSPWADMEAHAAKFAHVKLGEAVAMSTCARDQALVADLVRRKGSKVRPAFGYHPWFVHTISLEHPAPSAEQHYRSLFGGASATEAQLADLEELLPHLPAPVSLQDTLATLRGNLEAHPSALLGEVGIDRAFQLPVSPAGYTLDPAVRGPALAKKQAEETHSLGRRSRALTLLKTPLEHQLSVLTAQVELAVKLRRSVSMHSVKAPGATLQWLDEMKKRLPSATPSLAGMSKRKRRAVELAARSREAAAGPAKADDKPSPPGFEDINLDLHSCSLSPLQLQQVQEKHQNVYASFSTTINLRQQAFHSQLSVADPQRVLIESDWHSAAGLAARTWAVCRLLVDAQGEELTGPLPKDTSEEGRYRLGAEALQRNWRRFVGETQA